MELRPGSPRSRLSLRLHSVRARARGAQSGVRGGPELSWAPLTREDLDDLAQLVRRAETTDASPFRTDKDELREYFESPANCQIVGARDADGVLRAYGAVRIAAGATPVRAIGSGDVDPAWRDRGVGTAIVEWQRNAGTELVQRIAPQTGGTLLVHVDSSRSGTSALLDRAGFVVGRELTQVRRDLSLEIPEVELERTLSLQPWRSDLEDLVRRTHNRSFEGSGLAPQYSAEEWFAERTYFVPEWSFLVLDVSSDRADVAGYLMSARYAQDWEAMGWTEGTTDLIGVLPPYRGRHVGSALVCAAMRAYREAGLEYAGMDIDVADPTGAGALARSLGFEPVHRSVAYQYTVPPSRTATAPQDTGSMPVITGPPPQN